MDIDEYMLNTVFSYWTPTNQQKDIIIVDERCIMYNQLYKSYDYYDDKFPEGYNNIPGFDLIIDKMVDKSQDNSPLKEIEMRAIEANDIISKQIRHD